MVLKYFQDRSLFFNQDTDDQSDYVGVSTSAKIEPILSSVDAVESSGGFGYLYNRQPFIKY